jgi:DNA repair protein RecN (Recombination protein N)
MDGREKAARLDLIAFQLGEIEKASPKAAEDEELLATRQVLANAERVQRLCEESYATLYERDGAVLAGLGGVWKRVGELAGIDPQFAPYMDARDGIKSQLEDLALFLRRYAEAVDASPARLQEVEDRLALLERLKRKHGPQLSDVIARREALRKEIADLEHGQERLAEAAEARRSAAAEYVRLASTLSQSRRGAAQAFSRQVEGLLAELAMEKTRFDVRFLDPLPQAEWTSSGIDRGEFYVSPNPGEDLRPLARIVSGGELSRVMLALKTLGATTRFGLSDAAGRPPSAGAPGLIFDEVDAGIGGRVADVVGRKLRALGSAFQVLCITHLPQIAAYADTHFLIDKGVEEGRTRTTVTRLDDAGRVDEMGRMLGGTTVSAGLRESAREMLEARRLAHRRATAKDEADTKGESESAAKAKAKGAPSRPSRKAAL